MSLIKNRRGMSLVEIMIVLAIIGSLMALLAPRVMGSLDKSKVKETNIKMGQLANSLSMYYTDCGKYPESLEGLVKEDANCTNWGPEAYYKGSLKDSWNNEFVYEGGGEFTLKSLGKDGGEGGSGFGKDLEYGIE